MALMVTAPPSFRLLPDSPPYESPPVEALSPVVPPEPPDPPDGVYLRALLRILVGSAKSSLQALTQTLDLKLPCSTMVSNLCGGGVSHVSSSDSSFVYGLLFPVVCRPSPCRFVEWSSLRSGPDLPFHPFVTVLQVHCNSSLFAYLNSVEWARVQAVWVIMNLRSLILVVNVLMDRVSFSSTFVPFSGIYIASVRSFTAVCRSSLVFSLVFGSVILCFSSLWQWEGNLIDIYCRLNMILTGIVFPVVSSLELFLFPIYLLVWSDLEVQVLLVLQGSSSQLILFSAVNAVLVILWITLDATFQEAYEIVVMRFLCFLFMICINSILCLVGFLGVVVSSSNGV